MWMKATLMPFGMSLWIKTYQNHLNKYKLKCPYGPRTWNKVQSIYEQTDERQIRILFFIFYYHWLPAARHWTPLSIYSLKLYAKWFRLISTLFEYTWTKHAAVWTLIECTAGDSFFFLFSFCTQRLWHMIHIVSFMKFFWNAIFFYSIEG